MIRSFFNILEKDLQRNLFFCNTLHSLSLQERALALKILMFFSRKMRTRKISKNYYHGTKSVSQAFVNTPPVRAPMPLVYTPLVNLPEVR